MPWRRLGTLLLAALIAVLLAWGFRPAPVVVETAVSGRAPLTVTLLEEGKTRVTDRYVVTAPVAGYMPRLPFKVGATVARGQELLPLEAVPAPVPDLRRRSEAQAQVAAAAAALDAARARTTAATAEAVLAQREHERIARLHASGMASAEQRDQAAARHEAGAAQARAAQFAEQVAQHELAAAQTALRFAGARDDTHPAPLRLTAPVEGVVLKVFRESEGVVAAGAPLLELGDPRSLEVEVDVLSMDAVRLTPGMELLLERWGGPLPLRGRVQRVEPAGFTKVSALGVEEQRVLVIAHLTSPPEEWQRLGDGYRVEARFLLWHGDDVLQVPASTLFRHDGGWAVFVAVGGRAERRTVELGQRTGQAAEIRAGLQAGEAVILHPSDQLEDGTRIERR